MPISPFERTPSSGTEDRYSFAAQRAGSEIKHERFRRERQEKGEDVPTPVLARAFLELRRAIADTASSESHAADAVPALTELLRDHPEVKREFSALVRGLVHGQTTDAYGRIVPLDIDDPHWRARSEGWIQALLAVAVEATPAQRAEIRRSAERYLQAYASVLYARTLERFVSGSVRRRAHELRDAWNRKGALHEIEQEVRRRFDLSPTEARHLVAMHIPTDRPTETFKEKMAYLREIWEQNAKEIPHRALIESVALTAISGLVDANLPKRSEASFQEDRFSLQAYVAYMVWEVSADLLRSVEDNAAKRVRHRWDREVVLRSVESKLFRRGEHDDVQDPERAEEMIEEGTEAMQDLRHLVLDRVGPTVIGLCTTLAAIARLHPLAALAGAGSLPLLAYVELVRSDLQRQERQAENAAREAARAKQRIYGHDLEGIRLTTEAKRILDTLTDSERLANEDVPHETLLRRKIRHTAAKYAGALTAGIVTHLVQETGAVQGKASRELLQQLRELDNKARALVAETNEKLDERIEKIRAMEKALGPKEEYDAPQGLRERARLPASKLPSYDISLEGLWYGVLKGVSTTIREGEMVHLIGPSGSGKSTILKQIVGTLSSAYGEVRIGGLPHHAIRRYGEDSLYEIMAYAEQHPKINQKASVRENLLALVPSLRVDDAEIRSLLGSLGLGELAKELDQPIEHPLSGGELTRFGLAKALIRRPKILLLDEPTGPLDQKTARGIWRLIDDLHATHPRLTMIVVTHDPVRLERIDQGQGSRSRIIQMEDLHAQSDATQQRGPRKPSSPRS